MVWGPVIAGGIGLLGNLLNRGESKEEKLAKEQLLASQQQYGDQPDYQAPILNYTPSRYLDAETPDATLVSEDPNMRAAQLSALNSLLTRSNEGITAEEQRAADLSRRKQEQTSQGDQEAIMQNMAARGVGGSGMEYALRQDAAQQAADTASQGGLAREATNAEQKLAALNGLMSGASSVRGQDYTANKGNADITNTFAQENSRRRNAVSAANTELANKSSAEARNAATTNYNNAYNADVARRGNMANQNANMANFYGQQDTANTANNNNAWSNVGNIAAGAYNAFSSNPTSTTNTSNTASVPMNQGNFSLSGTIDPYTGKKIV